MIKRLSFVKDEEEEKPFDWTQKLTKLVPREEYRFRKDYKEMAVKKGLSSNPDDPLHYYDYRGLWKETGKLEPDETGHFPSKYKLKGHPDMYVKGIKTKEEEKPGWKQRTRGIGELPKYEIPKPIELKPTGKIGLGIGAKPKVGIELPEKPELEVKPTEIKRLGLVKEKEEVELVKPEEEDFALPLTRIKYYESKINWLEGIAKKKGYLGESGYDAYRYSIEQYNKAVDEYTSSLEAGKKLLKTEGEVLSYDAKEIAEQLKKKTYTPGIMEEIKRGNALAGTIATFGVMLTKIPKQVAVGVLQASQGKEGASVVNRDWADQYIKSASEDIEGFIKEAKARYGNRKFGIWTISDLAELPQNMGYSLTSMGAGLAVGVPVGIVPLPGFRVAGYILGTAASGKVAYNATTYQIMEQYLDLKNEESILTTGKEITLEEENRLKKEFDRLAHQYGLWEAIPEAISNLAFFSILTAPLNKMVGKTIAGQIVTKLTGLYGEELITETITQMGQAEIEAKVGMREGTREWLSAKDWIKSLKEVAPQTFLLTTLMAGAGSTIIKTKEMFSKAKVSLKNEVGETHPLYNKLLEGLKIQLENLGFVPREEVALAYKAKKPKIKPERIKPIPKEPWQMTFGVFQMTPLSPYAERIKEANLKEFNEFTYRDDRERFLHKKIIKEAITEGKSIPLEVLKEYPGLKVEPKLLDPELKKEYLKEIAKEVKVADDYQELGKDIREDIPISEELQSKYPDLMKKIPEAKFAEIEVKPVVPEVEEKPMIRGINFEENPEVYRAVAKADDIIEKSKLKIKYPLPEIDIVIRELKDAMMDRTLNTEQKRQVSEEFTQLEETRKDIEMKPTEYTEIEIKEAIVPEILEKQSIFLYDKPFAKLKKAELNKVLETTKQALPDETGEYINKIGTPAKGLELRPTADEHANFIFGGYEKGKLTDSHLLVLDETVSKKVLTDIIEKYKKARVKEVQSPEISYKEAQKIVDKEIEGYKKEYVKQFPDVEKILPEGAIEKSTPLWIQGHQVTELGPPVTILTDGKIQVALDTNKLAFLNKYFPNAEIKATGENQAVLFMEGKTLKAMVMPIRMEEYPFKITGEPTVRKPAEKVEPTIKRISKVRPTIAVKPTTYDLKKDLTTEQRIEGNKLMGQIYKIANQKGLTDKALTDIKRKYGLSPHLATDTRRMTIPQLQAVLKAVERARPKRIGYQKVITRKTEGKIQTLKDSLIEKYQMTEKAYEETLKDLGIYKEPRYIDAKHFITEEQGKELIYRLIDEAEILKITEPLRIAVEKNPEIKKLADVIDRRVKAEGERTIKDPHDLNSARSYFQILETISGAPLFTLYQDLINCHLENRADLNHLIEGFDEYRDIIKDEKELKKVEDWILAKSDLKGKPETPVNITPKEIELAKKIEGILKDYQSRARTEKFLDNIDNLSAMPQYLEYKKEIDKALDIYESKGYDDLVKYMKTQEWGVIKSGYDPLQVLSAKVRVYKAKGLSVIFGKEHIKVRKDIEYKEQETNVITRVIAYKRQMDNLSLMAPKVRALITLANKNLDKFKNPKRVRTNLGVFFRELKGYDRSTGWFERGINRIYSQAMITIIMCSPPLAFRNLGQNFGLGHDKAMLVDPRNKKLTPHNTVFLDTHVQQAIFMRTDWFMTGEKPLPGLAWLTNVIKKINLYPRSDVANRHWGFWGKINQVRMAFEDKTISLKKKTEKAKFSDFSLLEQKRALQILAKDGQEAMNEYVAKVYVDDVHFLYERAQRSLAEMGPYGKVFGNLMLFPRAYWEKLTKMSKKMTGKYVPFNERTRAFKVIASILIGGALVGIAYTKTTGRRKPPYDPLVLLAYQTGGLMIGTVEALNEVYVDTIMAVRGDRRALAALTSSVPKLADHFIPFYNYALRGYEAFLGDPLVNKNIDVYALKKLRQLVDNEYKIRGGVHSVERNAIEKWQYFLSGAGIDVAIAERKKKEKEVEPITIGKPKIPRLGIPKISKPGIKRLSPVRKF
ncbi:hypothetical protein ES702_02253 [subsurface metagenome]